MVAAAGQERTFAYDDLNRQTHERWIKADGTTVDRTFKYDYDARSSLETVTESANVDAIALEVSELLVKKAVSFIQRLLSTCSIISLWESGQSPGITDGERDDLLAVLKAKREGDAT